MHNDHHSDDMGLSQDAPLEARGGFGSSQRQSSRQGSRARGSGTARVGERRSALPGSGSRAVVGSSSRAPSGPSTLQAASGPQSQPRLGRRDEGQKLERIAELREELLVLALESSPAQRELDLIERELAAGLGAVDEWLEPGAPGAAQRELSLEDFVSWRSRVGAALRGMDAALASGRESRQWSEVPAELWPADVQHEVACQRAALMELVREMPLREAAATRLIAAARAAFGVRYLRNGSGRRHSLDLTRRWEAADRRARAAEAQFVQANQGLVALVVKRYLGVGLSYSDLMQEGNIGLLRAVEKFDCRRGCRFSTYATWWIRQAVRRALANQARTIRLPVHTADARYALRQASSRLEARLGREASNRELAEHMGVAASKVGKLMNLVNEPVSLEAPRGEGGDTCLYDSLSDSDAEDPASSAHERQVKGHLEQLVAALPPREAKMVRLRFGLDGRHERTLDEVGVEFGLTRERVRQLLEKALAKLRHVVPEDWRAAEV